MRFLAWVMLVAILVGIANSPAAQAQVTATDRPSEAYYERRAEVRSAPGAPSGAPAGQLVSAARPAASVATDDMSSAPIPRMMMPGEGGMPMYDPGWPMMMDPGQSPGYGDCPPGGDCPSDGDHGADGHGAGGHGCGCFFPDAMAGWTEVSSYRRGWVGFDYLNLRSKGDRMPPLVTTSPLGTPQTAAGVLGQPNTEVLFGNQDVSGLPILGGRLSVGMWWTQAEYLGYEGYYMLMEDSRQRFSFASTFSTGGLSDPILARPFFNVVTGLQDSLLIAFPGVNPGPGQYDLDGHVTIESHTQAQSAGVMRRDILYIDSMSNCRTFLVTGYRFFRLDEGLQIGDRLLPVGGPFAAGSQIDSFDVFDTRTEFHGGEVGLQTEWAAGPFSLRALGKLGIGNSHNVTNVRGATAVFDGATSTTFAGGLLTEPTNIGRRSRNDFALLPEAGVNLDLQITCHLRATCGYNFLYLNRVVRPGDQIDLTLNPTQFDGGTLVGAARPASVIRTTDYWLYGMNAGLEWKW